MKEEEEEDWGKEKRSESEVEKKRAEGHFRSWRKGGSRGAGLERANQHKDRKNRERRHHRGTSKSVSQFVQGRILTQPE